MKSVFVLFTLILISACVSKPTWDNMSEENISAWKSLGLGAEAANFFLLKMILRQLSTVNGSQ